MKEFNVTLAYAKNDKKINFPVLQQPKLDGIRCYFTKDGAFSRNHKQFFNVAHLEMVLSDFFLDNPDVILDGELYNHKLKNDFEKIVSLVRKQKPTDEMRLEASGLVEYHIYDIYSPHEIDATQTERTKILDILFEDALARPGVVPVDTVVADGQDAVEKFNTRCLDLGYEGSMIRTMNTPYKQKRSWDLQKVKTFKDTEATIVGFVEGRGKLEGKLGKFIAQDEDGNEFGMPPTACSHVERGTMWENRESYIGKVATFVYFERTKAGSYRFPVFKALRNYE